MVFEIFTLFHFPQKSKMVAKSGENWNFPLCIGYSCTTLWVKNSLKITLSRTVFEIFTLFHFLQKSKMVAKSGENLNFSSLHRLLLYYSAGQKFAWLPPKVVKIEIFPLYVGYSCTTLWVKNSLEIALSLMVFMIFTLFHFPLKSKMAAKSGENWNFSLLHRILLYYPVGQKFARNRSIYYGFRDICDFFHISTKSSNKYVAITHLYIEQQVWNLNMLQFTKK